MKEKADNYFDPLPHIFGLAIVTVMKDEFGKYFDPFPLIFCLAIVVDHRCKDSDLQTLLYVHHFRE